MNKKDALIVKVNQLLKMDIMEMVANDGCVILANDPFIGLTKLISRVKNKFGLNDGSQKAILSDNSNLKVGWGVPNCIKLFIIGLLICPKSKINLSRIINIFSWTAHFYIAPLAW